MPGVFTDFTLVERLLERIMFPRIPPPPNWGKFFGGGNVEGFMF